MIFIYNNFEVKNPIISELAMMNRSIIQYPYFFPTHTYMYYPFPPSVAYFPQCYAPNQEQEASFRKQSQSGGQNVHGINSLTAMSVDSPTPTPKTPQKTKIIFKSHTEQKKTRRGPRDDNIELVNRNILPNTINVILSYIRRVNKSKKVVEAIIESFQKTGIIQQNASAQLTVKKFYAYQNFLKNNINDFISRRAIEALMNYSNIHCAFFNAEEQQFYNKVFRVMVKKYLREEYLLYSVGSPKMNEEKRRDHLKVLRYLDRTITCREQSE